MMKAKTQAEWRAMNANRKLFKLGTPLNVIRINTGNTKVHEQKKFDLCWNMAKNGQDYMTEAEFKGGRCDVVNLSTGIIHEIVHSEEAKSIEKKEKIYPLRILVWEV